MIISGNFICINKDDVVTTFNDEGIEISNLVCTWFNLNSISSLKCFDDRYELTLTNNYDVEYILTSAAATELIDYMRFDRDIETLRSIQTGKMKKDYKELKEKIKEEIECTNA